MNENDNKEITREIGRRIKTLRLEKGYTLKVLDGASFRLNTQLYMNYYLFGPGKKI